MRFRGQVEVENLCSFRNGVGLKSKAKVMEYHYIVVLRLSFLIK